MLLTALINISKQNSYKTTKLVLGVFALLLLARLLLPCSMHIGEEVKQKGSLKHSYQTIILPFLPVRLYDASE